jgi:hypothetical protein
MVTLHRRSRVGPVRFSPGIGRAGEPILSNPSLTLINEQSSQTNRQKTVLTRPNPNSPVPLG